MREIYIVKFTPRTETSAAILEIDVDGVNHQIVCTSKNYWGDDEQPAFKVGEGSKEDFSIELETYFNVKISGNGWSFILKTMPERPTLSYFKDVELSNINYNDGIQSRSRSSRLLIFTQNWVEVFDGKSIDAMCVVIGTSHTRNGKWSSTDYTISLAAGVKCVKITQGWDSGTFVEDVTTLKNIMSELGIKEVQPYFSEMFVKQHFFGTWKRYVALQEKLDSLYAIEQEQGVSFNSYVFEDYHINNRCGRSILLVDGVVFTGTEIPEKVIIERKDQRGGRGGGSTTYNLLIHESVLVEQIQENDPYGGDDSLETRGYSYNGTSWNAPTITEPNNEERENESPFSFLNGVFGE